MYLCARSFLPLCILVLVNYEFGSKSSTLVFNCFDISSCIFFMIFSCPSTAALGLPWSLTHSLTHLLTYSLTHLLTYSLTHLLTYSLTQQYNDFVNWGLAVLAVLFRSLVFAKTWGFASLVRFAHWYLLRKYLRLRLRHRPSAGPSACRRWASGLIFQLITLY